MTTRSLTTSAPRFFYGWVVLIACFLTTMMAFGVFINPLVEDMGWSHSALSFTYIMTAFLLPDRTGNILAVDAAQSFSLALRQQAQSAGTQVLITIGGASVSYQIYLDIAQQPAARQRFIQNVLLYIDEHGYDGVDLNFEGWFEGLTSA